jgi:adenosylhomocysteinase
MSSSDSKTRIDWIASSCRLLQATAAEFASTLPFAGLTIGTAIHLEPKTAALLTTLQAGGARVIATGNLNSTQPATIAYLAERGIRVIGEQTADASAHGRFLDAILAERPDLLLDNGGDLFARVAERSYPALRGGTEETTSGRARLAPLREAIKVPARHQRKSNQAIRREQACGRPKPVRKRHALHQSEHQWQARHSVRLWRLRARNGGVLSQRL